MQSSMLLLIHISPKPGSNPRLFLYTAKPPRLERLAVKRGINHDNMSMELQVGFEPTPRRLQVGCSTS